MKKLVFLILITCLVLLAFPLIDVQAQTPTPPPSGTIIKGDQLVVGNNFQLSADETLEGNLLLIGGTASTDAGSTAKGDLVLIGGALQINGTVTGQVVAVGGVINVGDSAVVDGDVTLIGATLNRSASAKINGNITEQSPDIFNFGKKDGSGLPLPARKSTLTRFLEATYGAIFMGVLAVLVGLLIPNNMKNMAAEMVREPLVSGGIGLLTIVVAPIVLVVVMITIILIPVSLLAFIGLGLAILLGLIVVGFELGHRLAGLFNTTWPVAISAGIGTLLLSLVTGYSGLIPCVGWLIGFVAVVIGLGAVVISRVGSTRYANRLVQAVIPPGGSTPPQPPDNSGQPPVNPPGN